MNSRLFRPLGLFELSKIWDKDMRGFPPRLPHQPVFYPVTNIGYARQIARDWNTQDEKSGFAGFVTAFDVRSDYLSKFEHHIVGSSEHVEYWIPAGQLDSFNAALSGRIRLEEGYFGPSFAGHIPEASGLKDKDALGQFLELARGSNSSAEIVSEIRANQKAVFLNWLFWSQHDFSEFNINERHKF
jgi:hypothetical protein